MPEWQVESVRGAMSRCGIGGEVKVGVVGRERGTWGGTSDSSYTCSPDILSELHLLQRTPWCSSQWSPSRSCWNRWHRPRRAGTPAAGSGPAGHWLNRTHIIGDQPQMLSRGRTFHTLPNLPKPCGKLNSRQVPSLSAHCLSEVISFLSLYGIYRPLPSGSHP